MIDFIDNVPTYKGRKIITYENGTQETVTITNADEPVVNGTPINRENMMAIQGFVSNNVYIDDEGNIIITNSKNETTTITPLVNGKRKTIFQGEKNIITLTTSFNKNGISEVLT